jgi:hypothetical protein
MLGIATGRAAAARDGADRAPQERDYGCEVRLAGGVPVPLGATVAMEWSPRWCHLMVQSSRALIFGSRPTAVNHLFWPGLPTSVRGQGPVPLRLALGGCA